MSHHIVRALMEQGAVLWCHVHQTHHDIQGNDPNKYGHPWLDHQTGDRFWCIRTIQPAVEAEKEAVSA